MQGILHLVTRFWIIIFITFSGLLQAAELEVIVTPRATVVDREGITGGGQTVHIDDHILITYTNHPDDFGGSFGTGSAWSTDNGQTWKQAKDNWPIPKTVSLWTDKLTNGDLLAMGIAWVPDPKKRRDATLPKAPADAYQIALSKDKGKNWTVTRATIDCPPEIGIIARPLPHIFEAKDGTLLMPAYAWSKKGNSYILLHSKNRGQHWEVRSVITTPTAINKAGGKVTTPWLESSVSPTKDGALLAIARTGSNAKSSLISLRSIDKGMTWSAPKVLPIVGKLPTLRLLPNGVLTLVTALSKNHCRIYISEDGTGQTWSKARIISSLTGGNVGVSISGSNQLIITTPANRRIDAWTVQIKPKAPETSDLTPPTNIKMNKGYLTWTASLNATAYRVTPVLINPGPIYGDTDILPYATTQTRDAMPKLELRRQLLPGSTYAFEIRTVDNKGRVTSTARSENFQL